MNTNTTELTLSQLINDTSSTLRLELIIFLLIVVITMGSCLYIIKQVLNNLPNNQIFIFLTYTLIVFLLLCITSFITIILDFLLTFWGYVLSFIIVGIALLFDISRIVEDFDR